MSSITPQRQAAGPVIAVLGGGYAGLFAARRAARAITRDSRAAVVLIDSDDVWQERTRWHQIAAGETVRSRNRARLFRGTSVATVPATVTGIDLQDRRLTFGDREPLAFDRLAHTLDTPKTSRRLAAAIAGRPDCRLLVVGGGLTGIQAAAHIARHHPGIHVSLASSGTIGDELHGAAQAAVDRALGNLGVEVIEKRRVESVDAESVRWAGRPDRGRRGGVDRGFRTLTAGGTGRPRRDQDRAGRGGCLTVLGLAFLRLAAATVPPCREPTPRMARTLPPRPGPRPG